MLGSDWSDLRLLARAVVEVPGPVEAIVEAQGEADGRHGAARHRAAQEGDEVSVIVVTHAGVDPGAVMVHLHHTPPTSPAVMRPRSLVALTLAAELELFSVLLPRDEIMRYNRFCTTVLYCAVLYCTSVQSWCLSSSIEVTYI